MTDGKDHVLSQADALTKKDTRSLVDDRLQCRPLVPILYKYLIISETILDNYPILISDNYPLFIWATILDGIRHLPYTILDNHGRSF